MRIRSVNTSLRKTVLLYRRIARHKGYGVHSPFVYGLITKVINERCPYYHFAGIEALRKQLPVQKETAGIVASRAISPKQGALLFRLANYFRPERILQIGASAGLSTLYLTSYKPGVKCIVLEKTPEQASVARWVYRQTAARTPVDLRTGDYRTLLPGILEEMPAVDFVFFNTREETDNASLFDACMKYAQAGAFFVFDGIKSNRAMREFWKTVCAHPEVTVTLDLYSMGIVFFSKKLHKRNYKVYF
ncbi:MAG: SAM-dependent methyltransferase [Tannerellaceae bacterium]|jgi:predicted O-methyltransferase YrrM|nr:SAM-dependent methyltransferase [Tannerellaceae bacterium]